MVKINVTTIIPPKNTDFVERFRQDLERDVHHAVQTRRVTLRLLQLKIHGLLRKLPS